MRIAFAISVFLLVVAGSLACSSTIQERDVVGTYQECYIHCQTFEFFPDRTFKMTLDGDLFNDQSTTGTWELDGRLLTLRSDIQTCSPTMSESDQGLVGEIEIRVTTDWMGNPLGVLDGYVGAHKANFSVEAVPGLDGVIRLPIENPSRITASGMYFGECWYEVKDPDSDTFEFSVTHEELAPISYETYYLTQEGIIKASSWEMKRVKTKKHAPNKIVPADRDPHERGSRPLNSNR
jgi:hypothetical protein